MFETFELTYYKVQEQHLKVVLTPKNQIRVRNERKIKGDFKIFEHIRMSEKNF